MWNDGMDRRFILQWSKMLPKEFMVEARWYRIPRSKPHLQLGCLVCWLNHKFCQWLVKMCVRNSRPLSSCTGEESCLWAEGTSLNTKLHQQLRVYTTTVRFYLPPLLYTQSNASILKTNTLVAVFNRVFREKEGVKVWRGGWRSQLSGLYLQAGLSVATGPAFLQPKVF